MEKVLIKKEGSVPINKQREGKNDDTGLDMGDGKVVGSCGCGCEL